MSESPDLSRSGGENAEVAVDAECSYNRNHCDCTASAARCSVEDLGVLLIGSVRSNMDSDVYGTDPDVWKYRRGL